MVENMSRSLFMPSRAGGGLFLILCLNLVLCSASPLETSSLETSLVSNVSAADEPDDFFDNSPPPSSPIDNNATHLLNMTTEMDEDELMLTPFNTTEHKGFLHGFVESLSVILVSELGDKTFFIAAILAMRNNKLTVFLAAIAALAVMTVMSALLGFVVTQFIPREYTYYACTAIMFLFGLKMLWEAWRMSPDEGAETQREVEEELARRGSNSSATAADSSGQPEGQAEAGTEEEMRNLSSAEAATAASPASEPKAATEAIDGKPLGVRLRENSWFGKKCVKIFKIFTNTFTMTFLAEWGDRSQLATIVMAGINDVTGVCVGGVLGHFICTGLAVICGALIAKKISVRTVTLIGALVFIGFAIASLFIDPNEENHLVPDVEGDDHNSTVFRLNHIEFVESTTGYATALN